MKSIKENKGQYQIFQMIIHHYYHTAGYAIPPHSSLVADTDSNSSQSA